MYCMSLDVALAPNNNEVQIHQLAAGKWKLLETLSEHGQRVTGIDWAPTSNRIVTCGAVSYPEHSALAHYTVSHEKHGRLVLILIMPPLPVGGGGVISEIY